MEPIFYGEEQLYLNWCWAAATTNVYRYFHPKNPLEQCTVAEKFLSSSNVPQANACCEDPIPESLDRPAKLDKVLQLSDINLLQDFVDAPLSFDIVKQQLRRALPVCARIGWYGQNRGHFVIIIGYGVTSSNEHWLDIADPFFGYQSVPYDWFRNSYMEMGTWTRSYYIKDPSTTA